jgi:hypothetical protein
MHLRKIGHEWLHAAARAAVINHDDLQRRVRHVPQRVEQRAGGFGLVVMNGDEGKRAVGQAWVRVGC